MWRRALGTKRGPSEHRGERASLDCVQAHDLPARDRWTPRRVTEVRTLQPSHQDSQDGCCCALIRSGGLQEHTLPADGQTGQTLPRSVDFRFTALQACIVNVAENNQLHAHELGGGELWTSRKQRAPRKEGGE